MAYDAVLRNLAVIGEAVKVLSTDLKDAHPLRDVAGRLDVLGIGEQLSYCAQLSTSSPHMSPVHARPHTASG